MWVHKIRDVEQKVEISICIIQLWNKTFYWSIYSLTVVTHTIFKYWTLHIAQVVTTQTKPRSPVPPRQKHPTNPPVPPPAWRARAFSPLRHALSSDPPRATCRMASVETAAEHERILREIESTDTNCIGPTLRSVTPPRREQRNPGVAQLGGGYPRLAPS